MPTLFAPAKLTVSLAVTGVRPDGMHEIDAEMVTLDFGDSLEVEEGDGLEVVGRPDLDLGPDNLIDRALRLVGRTAFVRLHKHIPPGAGLGGGSADAAAILRWAGFADLVAAAGIGADVAYCLHGGRARVRGIGEKVEPLDHIDQTFTLFTPELFCSTPAVYRRWDELGAPAGDHGNDLEPAALDLVPEMADARDRLAQHCGQRPRLAGSGSTWFVEGTHPGPGYRVCRSTPV